MAKRIEESENVVKRAVAVKHQYEQEWMSVSGVAGVGVGFMENGKVGIIISITVNPEEITYRFPEQIDDIPVEMKYTGTIKAK